MAVFNLLCQICFPVKFFLYEIYGDGKQVFVCVSGCIPRCYGLMRMYYLCIQLFVHVFILVSIVVYNRITFLGYVIKVLELC